MTAAQKVAEIRMSKRSLIRAPPAPACQKNGQHHEQQRRGKQHVGNVGRHMRRTAHGVGAHEYAGHEQSP